MPDGAVLLAVVTLQRVAELGLSARNTRGLMRRGAVEVGAAHCPAIVAVHAAWLASLWWFGWDAPLVPLWVAVYAGLRVVRAWILLSLGERWTTRVIVVDEPPVRRGPYRYMRHPNCTLVVLEIAVVPLALGEPMLALAFSALNALVLAVRIRTEDAALDAIR